jgi:hypothetical protein
MNIEPSIALQGKCLFFLIFLFLFILFVYHNFFHDHSGPSGRLKASPLSFLEEFSAFFLTPQTQPFWSNLHRTVHKEEAYP